MIAKVMYCSNALFQSDSAPPGKPVQRVLSSAMGRIDSGSTAAVLLDPQDHRPLLPQAGHSIVSMPRLLCQVRRLLDPLLFESHGNDVELQLDEASRHRGQPVSVILAPSDVRVLQLGIGAQEKAAHELHPALGLGAPAVYFDLKRAGSGRDVAKAVARQEVATKAVLAPHLAKFWRRKVQMGGLWGEFATHCPRTLPHECVWNESSSDPRYWHACNSWFQKRTERERGSETVGN